MRGEMEVKQMNNKYILGEVGRCLDESSTGHNRSRSHRHREECHTKGKEERSLHG